MPKLSATTHAKAKHPTTILQFGEGNFLRAFADQMIDSANKAGVMDDGIAVVTPIPGKSVVGDILDNQDGLYHVVLEGVRNGEPIRKIELVESINGVTSAHDQFNEYRDLYLNPDLKAVISNTTEAGITFVADDDITANPPASFPAKVTALLFDRWQHFDGAVDKGLVFAPVELIENNGSTLREYVIRHAENNNLPQEFIHWVKGSNSFHNTLVDRIVPGFPRDEIGKITEEIGFNDDAVVKGEYFGSWAIDGGVDDNDGMVSARPNIREILPLDEAGQPVEFMADIRPYRAKKVRILNGLHTAMAAIGLLSGAETVGEAVAKPEIQKYLTVLLTEEILPSIENNSALMGDDTPESLEAFAAKIVERFGNPYLRHNLGDIALNSISKWQTRNLPVVLDLWANGQPADAEILAFAALCVLYAGGGVGADAVPAGFEVRDDADLVANMRAAFPDGNAGSTVANIGALTDWFGCIIKHAGFFAEDQQGDADGLAHEAAGYANTILTEGIDAALAEITD